MDCLATVLVLRMQFSYVLVLLSCVSEFYSRSLLAFKE